MNLFTFSAKNGIVKNILRIIDLCRTTETDSTNLSDSIEPILRTTGLVYLSSYKMHELYKQHDTPVFIIF